MLFAYGRAKKNALAANNVVLVSEASADIFLTNAWTIKFFSSGERSDGSSSSQINPRVSREASLI